jgi:hypothetical protein
MASQIFNFPGFYDREIDLTARQEAPVGVPAGVIGAAERGPAFAPITVGSFADFNSRFGDLNPRFAAPYAVERFLANKTALTFIRVLGAGANATSTDIDTTRTQGTVKNAGFKISGSTILVAADVAKQEGAVQFIVAKHSVSGNEAFAMPMFTDNNSITTITNGTYLVRGAVFMASGTRMQVLDGAGEAWAAGIDDVAAPIAATRYFKLAISSSAGASFGTSDGFAGVRIYTASLDPADNNYFAKLLNTDPEKFNEEKHLVYADFAVDAEVATLVSGAGAVGIASGTLGTSTNSGNTSLPFLESFGRFDTRYTSPKTPWFISQPYGNTEYDLFYIEAIDDGAYANQKIKVSVTNLLKSANPRDKHGAFTIVIRDFFDTDVEPRILEQFNNVSLNPDADNFIGNVIGDIKIRFNFDSEATEDRRLLTTGKYGNRSRNVRVVISDAVTNKQIPADALPFGFRGYNLLNTNTLMSDTTGSSGLRLSVLSGSGGASLTGRLAGAIVPPIPFTFKVTRGDIDNSGTKLFGGSGPTELADPRYYWGVKFTRNSDDLNPNIVSLPNNLINSFTKFMGISKLDMLITGSSVDDFNNNKFSLAKVVLGNTTIADVTSSAANHMKEAAYKRNATLDSFDYTVSASAGFASGRRITLAALYQKGTTAADFNRFSNYAKFTCFMHGGFDGTNILDKNAVTFNDRSTSAETRTTDAQIGNAASTFVSPGFAYNQNGPGIQNATVNSFRVAADIATDAVASNINILAVPDQRDPLVTDYVADAVREFSIAFFVMDVPTYDSNNERVWSNETTKFIDVEQTANEFEQRALDNEYVGAYFPDIVVDDLVNRRRVNVPATVGAIAALGFNDKIAFPWFAPAGFNRAALDFVVKTRTKIKQSERERLFDIHINPIIKFPGNDSHVIFAQNTLEQEESALGSINVVRMLNDLKRQIIEIGNHTLWEQITPSLYTELEKSFRGVLNTITSRSGIERYDVIIDARNNTSTDRENNTINGKIVLVPTRAIEFISIDFVITRSGVAFA